MPTSGRGATGRRGGDVMSALDPVSDAELNAHAERHLRSITHRLPTGLVVTLVSFHPVRVIATVDVDSIGAAVDAVAAVRHDRQVYAGTYALEDDTAARLIAEGRRGGAAEVAAIHSVIADVDIAGPGHRAAKNYPHDLDEAHAVLDGVGIDWSFVVATGGGLGAWAVLEEPLLVGGDEDRDEIQRLLGQFANGVDASAQRVGREVDHLADLPRVMRLAGTYNLKAGGKVPAVLNSWNTGVVLGNDDLVAACVTDPPVSHHETPARVPARRSLLELKATRPNIFAKAIDPLEWSEIWPAGWRRRKDTTIDGQAVERWQRPGASSDHSVVCWPGGGCKVHSDAVPGLPAGNYSKAEVVARLAGISLSDLARRLWQRGAA